MYIPEWEIENAIVWNPALVEISGRLEKLSFIENQKYLKNTGRYIDILFKSDDKLVIVEVKCIYIDEPAIIFDQVLEYKKELSSELGVPKEKIVCSLVSPMGFSEEVLSLCNNLGIFTKKLDENEIICSTPKNKPKVKSNILPDHIKSDLKIDNKFMKILRKRNSNFSNLKFTNESSKNKEIINEIESIKKLKNDGIHDELAKKRIGEIFTEISKNAPIRAHEVNTNSDGRLVDNYDKWFWLFYSVMDRRSNAANFVKAKEALEKKDLFNPYKIIKLIGEKDEKTAINRIASILENSRFPLMRDSTMGDLAFPRSIVEAAKFISKYDYDLKDFTRIISIIQMEIHILLIKLYEKT